MKKVFATVLLVTYFAFSSGVVINYHYCMNELASAKIFEKDQGVCGACGMHNNNDGCCHDEVKVLKAEDEQSVPATLTLVINAPEAGEFSISEFLFLPLQNQGEELYAESPPPPLLAREDIYLENRVFRI